ncbi:hypothetical protein JCM10296v2_004133 [Rhodotorula toruloides]
MAFNGMSQVPSVTQRPLAVTATQFSSFATPAITVPFPSIYAGQSQIPFQFANTATFAATRVLTTIGGTAATSGVASINAQASSAGYKTSGYGNNGGGGGWPTWATAVIAACGGAAVILIVIGLFCWRLRRKQKARKRAAAVLAASAGGPPRHRKLAKDGGLTEKPVGGVATDARRTKNRRNEAALAAGVGAGAGLAAADARSHSQGKSRRQRGPSPQDGAYPPMPFAEGAASGRNSPSRARTRDLAALGINRPASRSPNRQRTHPDYSALAQPAPIFAPRHERDFSAGSTNELLPPAAPFAYREGDSRRRKGYETPPPRAPNTHWDDSPGQTGSPARLLANVDGYGSGYEQHGDTPRSSMTVSTRGTGGAPYRWDQERDLHAQMLPDVYDASAALGRAMMGGDDDASLADASSGSSGSRGAVRVALAGPAQDGRWANEESPQYPHIRSSSPNYPPSSNGDHTSAATSRAPSRQYQHSVRRSLFAGSADGHGISRSTTPVDHGGIASSASMPALGAPIALDHARAPSRAESRRTRNESRASTYETADEAAGRSSGEYTSRPRTPY